MRDLLAWMQGAMHTSKILDPASLTMVAAPFAQAVEAGQYAFDVDSRYSMWTYNDPKQCPKIAGKMRIAPIPSLDGKTKGTVLTTRMYCLTSDAQAKDDAYKLISFLGGLSSDGEPTTAEFWFRNEGLGYAYPELAKKSWVRNDIAKYAQPVSVYEELSEVAYPRTIVAAPWYDEWESQCQKTIQAVLTKASTPSAAVSTMAENARTLKKQYQ